MRSTGLEVRKRIMTLFLLFALVIVALMVRTFWVQVVRGEELAERALRNRMRDVPVRAKRGLILDRNGKELAISISTDSVYAIPPQVKKSRREQEIAHKLAEVLEMDEKTVYARLTKDAGFVWIKRQVDFDKSRILKKMDLPGIGFAEESRRFYPKGKLACHVLGISGVDNVGLDGIDLYYNNLIGGQDGRIVIEYDAVGREIPEATHRYIPPKDGYNVVLTIDETIQYIAERELDKVFSQRRAKSACVIVMDPRNGEILAMASRPNFDPNKYNDYPASYRRNYAVSDAYEPGSTMKILTAAAAMEEGVVKASDRFYCPGFIKVGKERISCAQGQKHGAMSFGQVVEHSCNVGFVTIGLKLGIEKYYQYLKNFGFGEKTGIDLPGEAKGIIVPQSRCKQIDLATMSIGQANAVTALQLVTAASAVANGGVLVQPHLLKEVVDSQGGVVKRFEGKPKHRVISRETASQLRLILEGVVQNGSGRNAFIEGYRVAGKTGTAQKVAPGGGYSHNEYVASFLGFAPADEPRLACIVVVDSPQGYPYYGGWVAAPVFKEIMKDSLRYLEVPINEFPREEQKGKEQAKRVLVPDLVNLSPQEAMWALKKADLTAEIKGKGDMVWQQVPKAYTEVKPKTRVIIYLSPVPAADREGEVTVPQLEGKTMKQVAKLLSELGLYMRAEGYGLAYKQEPEAGTKVKKATVIKVYFQPVE